VRDLCLTPGSQRLVAATFGGGSGRSIPWRALRPLASAVLGTPTSTAAIDGEDLIDLADGFGALQSSPVYRWQADLVGTSYGIDDADLNGLLAKFGGRP